MRNVFNLISETLKKNACGKQTNKGHAHQEYLHFYSYTFLPI